MAPLENYMINVVTIIQLEGLYGNIGRLCCTYGQCIFDTNVYNSLPLTTTYSDIICGNENSNDIKHLLSGFIGR